MHEEILGKINSIDTAGTVGGVFPIGDLIGGSGILGNLVTNAIIVGLVVAVIYIIVAAYRYIMSKGEDDQIKKAKNGIKYTLVGVILLFLALGIVNGLSVLLGGFEI